MKTNSFNFNRLGLLFQRYFIERFHTELIYWSILVIVFMLIRNVVPLMALLITIAGVFYAARFFRGIHFPGSGIAYFMIPATQLEKLIVGVVMTSFYYFVMMIITYIVGNLLGTFLNNVFASTNMMIGFSFFHYSPLQWKLFGTFGNLGFLQNGQANFLLYLFVLFLVGQSVYLLGSIYFKSNQFFATFLATNVIQFLLFILFAVELKLFGTGADLNLSYDWGTMVGNVLRILIWLLPPFFWVVSYFRLTEKQV